MKSSNQPLKKITKIQQQKNNRNRYSVFVDGEYCFSADEDTLVEHRLLKGKELTDSFIEEVLIADQRNKAKSAAFRYIGYKMRSEKEVRDKLKLLGYDDFIEEIISYLLENRYIDDREYALCYSREKINLKGFGRLRIEMELKSRGIDSKIISEALRESGYEDSELENAVMLAEKRAKRSYKDEADRFRKLYGFLLRKGYNPDTAKRAVESVLKGLDD